MPPLNGPLFSSTAQVKPYWWEAAPPEQSEAEPPARTQVAIIGAGFTGLSAAITLARAGREVTVFEAETPGWGASSRNGGMIGPEWATFHTAAAYGLDRAAAIVAEHYTANRYLKDLIDREGIECCHRVSGHFRGAMTPKTYDTMGRKLDRIRAVMPCSAFLVPRAEQGAEIGSDLYHGGMVTPDYAALHPGLYVQGLAASARRAGATIVSGRRVTTLRGEGAGFVLGTSASATKADQVLLASNGYTDSITPWLRRRVIPIRSAMIATEPLAPDTMARLMPRQRMLGGSQNIATYYRPSPDARRILFGGRVLKVGEGQVAQANALYLHSQMVRIFPELATTKIDYYWHGQTAFTFDKLPHLGEIEGMFFAAGYCGTGVARATWFGHTIARRMLGDRSDPSAYEGLNMRTRPLYRGKPWFLPAAVLYYEMLDRWLRS